MKIPERMPEKSFYYHFKHDPAEGLENYAYEVVGIVRHSEDETYLVLYRPLYKNTYLDLAEYSVRPVEMFMEDVTRDGKTFPRFRRITDPEILAKLKAIKNNLYNKGTELDQ